MAQTQTAQRNPIFNYENGLLLILGISFGFAFFDRNASNPLSPYITKEFGLNNREVGLISLVLSFSWAVGAYFIARWSDAVGRRKPFLLAFLLIFSACSFLSGLAPSYPVLIAARLVMGAVEGPFLPVCLAIMAIESSPHRRGVNAGIMQNVFAALLGQSLAPYLLPIVAEDHGWRSAFYLSGVPGLVCAVAVYLWVREPSKEVQAAFHAPGADEARDDGQKMGIMDMLKVRNVFVSCLIAMFMVGWFIMGWAYLPNYLVMVRGLSGETMGSLLSVLGFASAVAGFGAPWLSDRLGRKPVMIGFCFLAALTGLGAMYFQGPNSILGTMLFIGWLASGTFPLFMGVIPGESMPRKYAATAMGLVVGVGEIVGGTVLVYLAGALADATHSLTNAILMMTACGAIGCVLCFFLVETAPVKLRGVAGQPVAAKAA